ncbi:hypothetical protein NEAUS06_0656 [Nematocida ausubeli]|nr:hypothetical protein NEAUS06_0656 [Nematocida ausubeli]
MSEVVIIIEGIKDEIATYLCKSFKYILQKEYSISCLEMDGLAISLMNPTFNGVSPNELKCREYFIELSKSKNVIMITDIEYRREDYYTEEYTIDTKYILVVNDSLVPGSPDLAYSDRRIEIETQSSPNNTNYYTMYNNCKNYKEKLIVLLNNIKRNLISCQKHKIVHKLYLLTRYSNLCVLNIGYNIFYMEESAVLENIKKLLASLKSKYTLYLYSKLNIANILHTYNIVNVIQVKSKHSVSKEGNKYKLSTGRSINITEIDRGLNVAQIVSMVERMEKSLLVGDISLLKGVIRYIKKDDMDVKIGSGSVIKLVVNGAEVIEKRYEVK